MALSPAVKTPESASSANPETFPARVPSLVPVSSQGKASIAALPAVKIPLMASAAPLRPVSMALLSSSAKLPHSFLLFSWSLSPGTPNSPARNETTPPNTVVTPPETSSANVSQSPLAVSWSLSAGTPNRPPRKETTPPNTAVIPSDTRPAKVSHAPMIVCCVSSGTPSRFITVVPIEPIAPVIAPRISVPMPAQSMSEWNSPFQMAVKISGSRATSCGSAWIRPTPSCTTASIPAGISSGSAAIRPSASPLISCTADRASVGRFSIRNLPRLVSRLVASCVIGPMFAVTASTTLCSRFIAAGSSVLARAGSLAARLPMIFVSMALSTGMASSAMSITLSSAPVTVSSSSSTSAGISSGATPSCRALATLPMLWLAASTSGWKAGISTRPIEFLSAVPVALKRCMESSKAPILARFSSEKTVPMALASLPRSRQALEPASIRGLSSLALLPNSCMATASRSVSFSILPSASMASQKTSSVLLRFPSKS